MSEFFEQGFVLKSNAVPTSLLAAATAELPTRITGPFHDQLFDEETLRTKFPSALQLRQYVVDAATEILGVAPEPVQNQLAVRTPGAGEWKKFHIDGNRMIDDYQNDWNQMPLFQIIAGIPLVSTNALDRGNLVVVPGAHRKVAGYIRDSWEKLTAYNDAHRAFADVFDFSDRLGMPQQPLLTELGDFYISDALMPHRALANHGQQRAVWYFRMGIPTTRGYKAFA
jgi:hypothetical protein